MKGREAEERGKIKDDTSFGDHSAWEKDEDIKLDWESLVKKMNEHEGKAVGRYCQFGLLHVTCQIHV